ncbi:MAG: bifunctional phosphopantothenoylcysteine decarboxylase/phosphopantothenate--cysteine ligase CoaBC [Chloroflexi bacterium]|nr:bifunctional phosphopantothenoylcysteine decarboxylase/phosphopantothenate--cysteine ligase CoaBC [Chloroflexota bacterium]MCL5109083.1 bifunctional phosphopantothenoylcysteine decarboxylase/phosphopantothenate--cysteine ligase CoaBC [Chloroflexota bacterium]
MPLQDRRVVLGVTGGIAAYKAVEIASQFVKLGADVDVVMTAAAQQFVLPLTFQSLTKRPVVVDMFHLLAEMHIGHVSLGERAEVVLIAPATANTIAKLASGLADDMLGSTVLATRAPVVLAPAMNDLMYENQVTQENLGRLRARGFTIVEPEYGRLAEGKMGKGRLAEPRVIVDIVRGVLGRTRDWAGKRVVVTAGGTQEPIDPVRYLTNRSSGRMGYAIAEAARDRGAAVTLISGLSSLPRPGGVEFVLARSAAEMLEQVMPACDGADLLVMAAAVADFRAAEVSTQKLKKFEEEGLVLRLVRNPDILKLAAERYGPLGLPVLVGFAAESENLVANARLKLAGKKVDLVVANDITAPGSGFGTETNKVVLVHQGGEEELPLLPKYDVAMRVLDVARQILSEREQGRARR